MSRLRGGWSSNHNCLKFKYAQGKMFINMPLLHRKALTATILLYTTTYCSSALYKNAQNTTFWVQSKNTADKTENSEIHGRPFR